MKALITMVCWILSSDAGFAASAIRDVDFKNFTYAWPAHLGDVPSSWTWLPQTPSNRVQLANGTHLFGEAGLQPAAAPYVELRSVTFGDLTGDGREEAAVDLLYSTGGTANWHYLCIYTLASGSPKLLGMLRSGSRADGGLIRVEVRNLQLVLDFADTKRRIADCCSEGWVRINSVWREGHFSEAGSRSYGDLR